MLDIGQTAAEINFGEGEGGNNRVRDEGYGPEASAQRGSLSLKPTLGSEWQMVEAEQWRRLRISLGIEQEGGAVREAEAGEEKPQASSSGQPGGRTGQLRLRRVNRAEVVPVPARLEDLIGAEHPARLIWEAVEQLDLSLFYEHLSVVEGGPGRTATDPQLWVALWLYASYEGLDCARQLAKRCVENLPYIWLCGGVAVNYHSLSDFRIKHEAALESLMSSLLAQLDGAGLVNWESQAQDGMRVRASAGAASFRRQPTLEKRLTEAQATLADLEKAEPERCSPAQQAAWQRAAQEKVERLQAALTEMPAARAAKVAAKREQARVSTTDALARVMKMADGGFRPAYNWQFAVETNNLIITGVAVTNSGSDKQQLSAMLAQVKQRCQRLPDNWLIDGGFVTLQAILAASRQGVCIYAPVPEPKDETRNRYLPLPDDPPAIAAWRTRMDTLPAKALYKQRAASVECVNAQVRAHRGIQQVRVRGQAKVKCVALWTAITHNLLIWIRHLKQSQVTPAVPLPLAV